MAERSIIGRVLLYNPIPPNSHIPITVMVNGAISRLTHQDLLAVDALAVCTVRNTTLRDAYYQVDVQDYYFYCGKVVLPFLLPPGGMRARPLADSWHSREHFLPLGEDFYAH